MVSSGGYGLTYSNREQMQAKMEALAGFYRGIMTYYRIGRTYQGRYINVFRIGNPNGGKVLLIGTVHGLETFTSEVLYFYAKWLCERPEREAFNILRRNCTYIIPALNIDSYNVKRKNANPTLTPTSAGVDINRNFLYGWCYGSTDPANWQYKGIGPLSEYENQAVHNFLYYERPPWTFTMHTGDGNSPVMQMLWPPTGQYAAYLDEIVDKQRAEAVARNVDINYPSDLTELHYWGPRAWLPDEAYYLGLSGMELEIHPEEDSQGPPPDPPFAEIEPEWLPRYLAYVIPINREVAIPLTRRTVDDGERRSFWKKPQKSTRGSRVVRLFQ